MTTTTGSTTPASAHARPSGTAGGLLLGLVSAVSFGSSGVLARSLLDAGWSSGAALTVRIVGAAVVLAVPTALLMRGRWAHARVAWRQLLAYGLLGVTLVQAGYFFAVATLPVAVAILIEFLAPVLVVLWVWVSGRVAPAPLTWLGVVLAVGGLLLVLDLGGGLRLSVTGLLWAGLAMVSLAVYFVVSARGMRGIPPVAGVGLGTAVGAVATLVLSLTGLLPWRSTTEATVLGGSLVPWWLPLLGLVLVATVAAYVTGLAAMRRLGPLVGSFVALTEVIFAALAAWLLLAQVPTATQVAGGVLVVGGAVAVRLGDRPREPEPTRLPIDSGVPAPGAGLGADPGPTVRPDHPSDEGAQRHHG